MQNNLPILIISYHCFKEDIMEIRVLRYFLAVVREESITKAAETLHITQPTLSRQLQQLEEELNTHLFIRGKHHMTLTDEGMLLKKRAEDIVELADKTEKEFLAQDDLISGDICIGSGETFAMHEVGKVMREFQNLYPAVQFHLFSGSADDVIEKLDKGLIDIGILVEPVNVEKYEYIRLQTKERWGILTLKDSALAQKSCVKAQELYGVPLMTSRRLIVQNYLSHWFHTDFDKLNIVATFNLINNASILVEEGIGHALTLENVTSHSHLTFVPFDPLLESGNVIVWRKHQVFSKASTRFLEMLKAKYE